MTRLQVGTRCGGEPNEGDRLPFCASAVKEKSMPPRNEPDAPDALLTVVKVAGILNVSIRSIRRFVAHKGAGRSAHRPVGAHHLQVLDTLYKEKLPIGKTYDRRSRSLLPHHTDVATLVVDVIMNIT
jgi:hypothetical protein